MTFYISPKWIVVDFLRNRLSDPRRRDDNLGSDTFNALEGQTRFDLTPSSGKISCITSVTVDGTEKKKWRDYYIDFRNERVYFFDGLTEDEVVIFNYKYGSTNWIYWDKTDEKLNALAFPRISVQIVSCPGTRLGQYEAVVEGNIRFQIDIWTKEKASDQIFEIDGRNYTGVELGEYLAYEITKAFEDYEEDLHPVLYSYEPVGMPRDLPFDSEYQSHHKIVECILKGLDLGRINT